MIRRFQLLVIAAILLIAAFSTGLAFLFYLVYLAILVVGGAYVLTRLGLADLEAGYAVDQLSGHVGDDSRSRTRCETRAGCRSPGSRSTTRRRCRAACPAARSRSGRAPSGRGWCEPR